MAFESYHEEMLRKVLSKDKIESVRIYEYGIFITTDDHEIEIMADDDKMMLEINDREFME